MDDEKKKVDYWQIVFTVSVVAGLPTIIGQVKDLLPFNINGTVFAVITGGIGALVGSGIYRLVKNKKVIYKILAYISLLVILFGGISLIAKFTSDSYVVKKEWNVIKNGKLSFEYPNKFSEIDLGEKPEDVETIFFFSDGKEDPLAMNLIFDFKTEPPAPDESLSGAILNTLESINAADVEWVDSVFYEDAVTTKVKYKIGKNERVGFGIIYFDKWHYEIAVFLPVSKDFSEDFLNKIINSLAVEE